MFVDLFSLSTLTAVYLYFQILITVLYNYEKKYTLIVFSPSFPTSQINIYYNNHYNIWYQFMDLHHLTSPIIKFN